MSRTLKALSASKAVDFLHDDPALFFSQFHAFDAAEQDLILQCIRDDLARMKQAGESWNRLCRLMPVTDRQIYDEEYLEVGLRPRSDLSDDESVIDDGFEHQEVIVAQNMREMWTLASKVAGMVSIVLVLLVSLITGQSPWETSIGVVWICSRRLLMAQ